MKKVSLEMRVSVHPVKASFWRNRHKIKPGMTLRDIGSFAGIKNPQQVKHHLDNMVRMGSIDYIGGEYVFPTEKSK